MEEKINGLMTPPFDPNEGMVEGGPMGPELEELKPYLRNIESKWWMETSHLDYYNLIPSPPLRGQK